MCHDSAMSRESYQDVIPITLLSLHHLVNCFGTIVFTCILKGQLLICIHSSMPRARHGMLQQGIEFLFVPGAIFSIIY